MSYKTAGALAALETFGLKTAVSEEWIKARVQNAARDPRVSDERLKAFTQRQFDRSNELQQQMQKIPMRSGRLSDVSRRSQLLGQSHKREGASFAGTLGQMGRVSDPVVPRSPVSTLARIPAAPSAPPRIGGGNLGRNLAIGAGVAAAGYGAYRLLRPSQPQQQPQQPPVA